MNFIKSIIIFIFLISFFSISVSAETSVIANAAYVCSAAPDTNYGSSTYLQISPGYYTYIELPFYGAPVTMHVWGGDNGNPSYNVYSVSAFSESTLNYTNRPSDIELISSGSLWMASYEYRTFIIPEPTRYIKIERSAGLAMSFQSDDHLTRYPYISYNIPPTIVNINTKITYSGTPLTGIVINDVNSTGGFPTEQGYVTLTPTSNSEKIYPITLIGNDLIDGFELQITATGSEVTSIPITVNDLGADRTYNIYLDGQFLEAIGEVTSYQYNMTSFSTHTLKAEYDYYVPPGDEDGGGSGPVTPPDENILPPTDEDEIIIEDDVITIGELTITKEQFQLLTIEQIKEMDIPQDVKDELIRMKSINVNWWLFILVISLTGLIVEGSHKKGHESIIIISFIGVIISAYKLGYF